MIANEKFGGGIIKVKVTGYLKNNTENELLKISAIGIKNKSKITYFDNDVKYTIKIKENEVYLSREGASFFNSFLFNNKKSTSNYLLKENNYNFDLEILTSFIDVKDNHIHINYKIVETNCDYEYQIEMSDVI